MIALLMALLMAACTDDGITGDITNDEPLTIAVSEVPWQIENMDITRSGETLASLQQTGFGLFSTSLGLNNQHVTWNATAMKWNLGATLIWPKPRPSDFLAYAPYHYDATLTDGKYTFDCPTNNTTDLLYGEHNTTGDVVNLQFHHALAKLSFGTITNSHLNNITLNSIVVKARVAQRLYSSGDLSLSSGQWTNLTPYDAEQAISFTDFDPDTEGVQTLTVNSGTTGNINVRDILLIPGPVVEITVTYNTTETITFTTTLEKGKNKTVNLTVGMNHEVVISN